MSKYLLVAIICLFIGLYAPSSYPEVVRLNLAGLKEKLSQNKGKVVILNFWSPF